MSDDFDQDTNPAITGQVFALVGPSVEKHQQSVEDLAKAVDTLAALCGDIDKNDVLRRGQRILVVDDDLENLISIVIGLVRFGFDADPVDSAGSAMAHLRTKLYDAAVIDVRLPGTQGDSFVAQLRSDTSLQGRFRTNARIPVVLISGFSATLSEKAAECGADDWLGKPFYPRDLVAKLVQLVPLDGE